MVSKWTQQKLWPKLLLTSLRLLNQEGYKFQYRTWQSQFSLVVFSPDMYGPRKNGFGNSHSSQTWPTLWWSKGSISWIWKTCFFLRKALHWQSKQLRVMSKWVSKNWSFTYNRPIIVSRGCDRQTESRTIYPQQFNLLNSDLKIHKSSKENSKDKWTAIPLPTSLYRRSSCSVAETYCQWFVTRFGPHRCHPCIHIYIYIYLSLSLSRDVRIVYDV